MASRARSSSPHAWGCFFPKPEELEDDGYRPLKPDHLVQPGTAWIDGVRRPPGTPSSIPADVARNIVAPRATAPRAPAPPAAPAAPIAHAAPPAPRIVQEPAGILPPLGPPDGGGGGMLPPMDPRPLAHRAAWPAAFPAVLLHALERVVKGHPDYAAAKAGDALAAARLIEALADAPAIDALIQRYHGVGPILVPVYAVEAGGRNLIPRALAQYIGAVSGWRVDRQIVQANQVGRTGRDGYYRLAVQPLFDGPVQAGAAYLMVDDFLGQGATLANLRGHIVHHGGQVVGGSALTGKPQSAILALSPATLARLRAVHDQALENWWREQFGFGFEQLTESEARYLIARTDAERIRAEILARLRAGG